MSGQDMLDQACTGYVRLKDFKTQTFSPTYKPCQDLMALEKLGQLMLGPVQSI